MSDLSGTDLLFSFLITWSVGLAPPVIIRYAVMRRPLAKWSAISIAALFCFLNLVLFTALGSQSKTHFALFLIAWLSYEILVRGKGKVSEAEKSETPEDPKETQVAEGVENTSAVATRSEKSSYQETVASNAPAIPADAEQSDAISDKQPIDRIVDLGGVRMTEVDNQANSNSHKKTPVRTTGANAYVLSILLLLVGAAGGFFVGKSIRPEGFETPRTLDECYGAVANAKTELGSRIMADYCAEKFDDFW